MSNETITPQYYFASPIYVHSKKEWVKPLIKATDFHIKKSKKRNAKLIKELKSEFGLSHHSTPLTEDPAFDNFQKFVGNTCAQILMSQGFDLDKSTLVFTELWVQEFSSKGGGHHITHTHWDDPRPAALMSKRPEKDNKVVTAATSQVNFDVEPGTCIFFNSYMPHGFHVDNGKEPFRFIHWNMQAIPNSVLNNKIERT
jgi:hypothetical protein